MGPRVNEAAMKRVTLWMLYYLGIIDGMSRCVESFKSFNPEPIGDHEWQREMRSHLPPELAALRQPNANGAPAVRIIEQEYTKATHETKRRHHTTRKRE
ncbi:MAG: hypothetical protein ABSF63_00245 [Candidatus Bathyarchaeia archaeon]